MSFSIEFAEESPSYNARIKVIGVGGSGNNAINTMIHFGLEGVEFISVNTDAQALNSNAAALRIPIGGAVTRGLGAGADPERGRKAALEDVTRLKEAIEGADMVFVTAGMGGGTGTGAAPVIAQLAREAGALTVGVVTKPFVFEGKQRARRAEQGIAMLGDYVDTLITIPNEKLISLADEELTFVEAFRKADEVLYQAVKGISDLITLDGTINVDFADVRTVMTAMGRALMGTGLAKGEGRARLAAQQAITSPLLDNISVEGATGVLINVVGGPEMKMKEVQEAASLVQEQAHEDANIIFGASIDPTMSDLIKVTVIATGFDRAEAQELPELPREVRRPVESRREATLSNSYREGFREPTTRETAVQPAAARFPSARPEPATVFSTRRAGATTAAPLQAGAPSSHGPQSVAVRERIAFPASGGHAAAPQGEIDWEVPAFQRRQGG